MKVGQTKGGKDKFKTVRGYRAPRPDDDVSTRVEAELAARIPGWQARDILPSEPIDELSNYDRGHRLYGIHDWKSMFSPRQLLAHCASVEVFQDMAHEAHGNGKVTEIDKAALLYLSIAIDKTLNYNTVASRWDVIRTAVRGIFDRHGFALQWSYGEIAPTIAGLGYDWAVEQTGKALEELIGLTREDLKAGELFAPNSRGKTTKITLGPADRLGIPDASMDRVVMDPPYYDNVMYAELSDFFYVWLKRTAGLLFPEAFVGYLTDKDQEAIANPARFRGQSGGAKNLAGHDYTVAGGEPVGGEYKWNR